MNLKQQNKFILLGVFLIILAAFFFELKPKILKHEKEVIFWQYWSGSEKEPLEALVLRFNKVHAKDYGFKVKLLSISMPQKKIMMAIAGNVAPDLVHLDGGMVVDFALRGALVDLSVIARKTKSDVAIQKKSEKSNAKSSAKTGPLDPSPTAQDDNVKTAQDDNVKTPQNDALLAMTQPFIPIYIEALKVKGIQYALPLMPTCEAMHVNKNLLDRYDLKTPETLEDIVSLQNRFKNLSELDRHVANAPRDDIKIFMPSWPPWTGKFLPILFGGNWGKQLSDGTWQVSANSPENIEAWTWVQENFASKFKPGELAAFTEGFSSYQSPDNPFYAGKVAVETNGVWERNLASIYSPKMNVEIAPFPARREKATLVSVDALAIPRNAKNKKEAMRFMLWLLKQGNVEGLALAQGKFSPLKEVSESFYFEHPNPYIKVFVELANSPNAKFFPQLPFIKRYERTIKEAYDKVLRMELSAEEALNELQKKFTD